MDAATRHAWGLVAQRIATGLRELAHLPVTADDEQAILAFPEPEGVTAAAEWARSIRSENVDARLLLRTRELPRSGLPGVSSARNRDLRGAELT